MWFVGRRVEPQLGEALRGGAQGLVLMSGTWSSQDRVPALPCDFCKYRYIIPTLQDTGKRCANLFPPELPARTSGCLCCDKRVREVSWKLGSQWRPNKEWR